MPDSKTTIEQNLQDRREVKKKDFCKRLNLQELQLQRQLQAISHNRIYGSMGSRP